MRSAYLVCATPRSGSTLLCEGLKATGVAGRPEEYFEAVAATGRPRRPEDYLRGLHDPEVHALVAAAGEPEPPAYSSLAGLHGYAEHLERVRRWGTTPNGVFGAKLMWDHLAELRARVPGGAAVLVPGDPSPRRAAARPRHAVGHAALGRRRPRPRGRLRGADRRPPGRDPPDARPRRRPRTPPRAERARDAPAVRRALRGLGRGVRP